MIEHERYEQWDAAYLLGALSPAERREFEEHLADCDRCPATLAELAAMPALLGALPTDDALALAAQQTSPAPVGQPSPDLLSRLLARLRRRRRTRRWIAAGVGALAAAAVVVGVVLPSTLGDAAAHPTATVALEQVASVPLEAQVELTSVHWGTRVAMSCTYTASDASSPTSYTHRYALYVIDRSGGAEPVSTWNAAPGQSVHTTGSMSTLLGEVERIELRDVSTHDTLLSHSFG